MKTCSICSHPNRERIDEAIIAGMANLHIEKKFKVSRETVRRHSKHVLALVKKHDEAQQLAQGGSLKAKVLMREADLLRIQQLAEGRNDFPTAISAIRELRQLLELQGKFEGVFKPQEVQVVAVNLDKDTSRRIAETYLERHPRSSDGEDDE
jgi:hypothetical protein